MDEEPVSKIIPARKSGLLIIQEEWDQSIEDIQDTDVEREIKKEELLVEFDNVFGPNFVRKRIEDDTLHHSGYILTVNQEMIPTDSSVCFEADQVLLSSIVHPGFDVQIICRQLVCEDGDATIDTSGSSSNNQGTGGRILVVCREIQGLLHCRSNGSAGTPGQDGLLGNPGQVGTPCPSRIELCKFPKKQGGDEKIQDRIKKIHAFDKGIVVQSEQIQVDHDNVWDYSCRPGKAGNDGKKGGNGGPGGNGGMIIIVADTMTRTQVVMSVEAGPGGLGGSGGAGGPGGAGANEGNVTFYTTNKGKIQDVGQYEISPAPSGKNGQNGLDGENGISGENGQTKELDFSFDYYSDAFPLTVLCRWKALPKNSYDELTDNDCAVLDFAKDVCRNRSQLDPVFGSLYRCVVRGEDEEI